MLYVIVFNAKIMYVMLYAMVLLKISAAGRQKWAGNLAAEQVQPLWSPLPRRQNPYRGTLFWEYIYIEIYMYYIPNIFQATMSKNRTYHDIYIYIYIYGRVSLGLADHEGG